MSKYNDLIDDATKLNEKELMEYYGYSGSFGRFQIRMKYINSWILHRLAFSSPHSGFAIKMQKARGVEIGKSCHFNPYAFIDLIYPKLVHIENNVTLGSFSMIFAHSNPTANLFLKNGEYPRKVGDVTIKIRCRFKSWLYCYIWSYNWKKFNRITWKCCYSGCARSLCCSR